MSPIRILIPIALLVIFIFWILYRLLIKKDLGKNLPSLYAGFFFIAVWGVIYFFILN
jgi:hypothetical protein